jgi:hypothetical protein
MAGAFSGTTSLDSEAAPLVSADLRGDCLEDTNDDCEAIAISADLRGDCLDDANDVWEAIADGDCCLCGGNART